MKRVILIPFFLLILTSFTSLSAQWAISYGGNDSDLARTIQQTNDGGYIIAGDTRSFGAGLNDIWILKLNSDGAIEWQLIYGGSYDDAACSVSQTNDGGYIVAGNTESFGAGLIDIWILKLDSYGSVEWCQIYGADDYDFVSSIQQTSDDGYIVAAFTYSFADYYTEGWILKLDSNGAIEWQRTYGASGHSQIKDEMDYFYSIQQTEDGGYIVGGATRSFDAGVNDGWLLKLSSSGAVEWQRTYGSSEPDSSDSVQQTADGGYVAAGYTKSYGAGANDFLVLRLYSDGNIDPSCGFVRSSEATITDTYISPEDTNIIPQATNITPFETGASLNDTEASVYSICPPQEYTLNILADYGGTTDPSPGSYRYEVGEVVTITAKADSGYKFGEWSGDVTGKNNPITITMDSDKSVTAIFRNACFLAKVFSDSSLYAQLESLRDFRDKYLLSNRFGRSLVNLYYRYSQFFAGVIAKHKVLRVSVRTRLLPLAAFSFSMVHLGPLATAVIFLLVFILLAFINSFFQGKLRRVKTKQPLAFYGLKKI